MVGRNHLGFSKLIVEFCGIKREADSIDGVAETSFDLMPELLQTRGIGGKIDSHKHAILESDVEFIVVKYSIDSQTGLSCLRPASEDVDA
jgi:hypothetical protein